MSAPRGHRTVRFLPILAIVLAAGVYTYIDRTAAPATTAELPQPVRTERPQQRTLLDTLSLESYVEADQTVTVIPLVSGSITEITVDVGDEVGEDDVVARIDPERYELYLRQADASFQVARSTYERTRSLYDANATTIQSLDQATAQYEAARSQRELAELQLGYATVRAPITGRVLARHRDTGDVASTETPLLTIGDLRRLVVTAEVPEQDYPRFAEDIDTIGVSIAAYGVSYPATIQTVAPFIAAETRTFRVTSAVGGDASGLRPGMSVTVTFILAKRENVPTLPYGARGYGGTLWYVEDGTARSVTVPAPFGDDEFFQIPDEYRDLEFIVEGQHFLSEGQAVEIVGSVR